ncbi:PKD domain-containing protein [Joostella sp. CR20]|uniref:PKD domain-containing protein n=1 Tax=Joostella sp. CR20 TaxID=2804312 RepID=UPI00313B42D5
MVKFYSLISYLFLMFEKRIKCSNGIISLIFIFFSVFTASAQDCSVNAGIDETICGDATSYQLSGSSSGNLSDSAVWSQAGGPSVVITDPTDPNTTITGMTGGNDYVFRYSATCSDGNDVFQEITISVENITIANAGGDVESCPDSSGSIVITGNAPANVGEVGEWSVVGGNDAGVTINNTNDENTTITLGQGSAGSTTLRWTITGPEYAPGLRCETYDEITIVNYGGVEPVDAGPDQVLNSCYTVSQSTNLQGSFAGNGLGGQQGTWSFVSGTREPNIVDPNSNTTTVNGLFEGTYVFRWTVDGPCVSGSDMVTITVEGATQDVTQASAENRNQVFCDTGVTQTTLVGNTPDFAGETVEWVQIEGPDATITDPNSPTTLVTGLSYNNTYRFRYIINNDNTGCSTSSTVTVSYNDNNLSIEANGGMDIIAACGLETVEIPFTVTGSGSNEYSIVSGPLLAFDYPTDYQSFSDSSPLELTFEKSGTYTISLRRRVTGNILSECDIVTDEINVTISKAPTPSNGGTGQILDCGVTTTALTGNEIESGKSVWSQVSGPNQANILNPFARVTAISGLEPGKYVFRYLVASAGGACDPDESSQSDVEVIVSDTIIDEDVDAGASQSDICTGVKVTLSGSEPDAGQTGTWSQVDDGAPQTVVFADVNDPNTTATGFDDTNQTYTLEWTVANNSSSCISSGSDQVQISTGDSVSPTQAVAGEDRCYEAGTESFKLEGNTPGIGETGIWTVSPAGPTISDVNDPSATVTVTENGEYTFTWTIGAATGCAPTVDDVLITIDNAASADAGPDQEDCATTFTMAATSSNGEGQWTQVYGSGGYTFSDETSPTSEVTFTYSGTYVFEWTVASGNCSTASDQVTINVGIPPTVANAGEDQTVCDGGNSVTMSANSFDEDVEIGSWTLVSGPAVSPTITDVNNPSTTITGLITGVYVFRWSIKGDPNCPASTDDVTVTIGTPANAGSDKQLCNATNVLLQAEAGSTGTWTQVSTTGNDAVIIQSPFNSHLANAQIEPGTEYVFEFTTDIEGCISSDQITVTNSGSPEYSPDAGADDQVCQADLSPVNTYTLNGNTPPDGVTAEWRISFQPDGASASFTDASSANTTITGLDVPGFYILEWNFSVGNCTTESDIIRLTVFPAPSTANAGADQDDACVLTAQMSATTPTAGVGLWTFEVDPSGGEAVIDSPNSPTTTISNITVLGTYTLKWTVSTIPSGEGTSCAPSEDTVDITFVDEPPFTAEAGPDQELCLQAPNTTTTTNLDATDFPVDDTTTVGTWSVVSGPNTPTFGNENNPNTSVLNLVAGTYEFMWTTERGGCTDSDTVIVEVSASPTAAEAGPNQTVAEFTTLVMAANTPTVGTGAWSQLSGPNEAVFTGVNNPNTTVTGTEKGIYYFVWTISNGVCEDASDIVRVEIIGSADLELTKTASKTMVSPGEVVTFSIEVFNNPARSTSDATNVEVSDALPAGYDVVSGTISDGGIYYSGNSAIRWEGLSVPLGETKTVTFDATINKTGPYENKALITGSDQVDPDSDPEVGFTEDDLADGIADDDEDTVTISVLQADLELTKSASHTQANIGESVGFRLFVKNNGPGNASDITVKDTIPDGYDFITGTASNNGVYNAGDKTITWSNLSVSNGFTNSLTYSASPNSTGTNYTNVAEITTSNSADPDSDPSSNSSEDDLNDGIDDDDEASLTVPIALTDLSLSKTVNTTTPNVGETITFTLTITNESDVDATGVTVEDYIPAGYAVKTINNSGLKQGNTIIWRDFAVPAGNSLTASVTAEVLAPTGGLDEYLNIAQVVAADQLDSDSTPDNDDGDQSEDDEDSAVVTPQMADLSVTKSVSPTSASIGDTVTFTVVVTNDGPSNATGVAIQDDLPAGYTLTAVNNGGSMSGNSAIWTNLNIVNGGSQTLTYEATVEPGNGGLLNYYNRVQVTASDQFDPDSTPDNDKPLEDDFAFAQISLVGDYVDIEVSKTYTSTNTPVNPGDEVTFTVSVTNTGTIDATGVEVTDQLRAGYTYSATAPVASQGTYDTSNGAWLVGDLAIGQVETLTITVDVVAVADEEQYVNVARLTDVDQTDIDSSPGNNDPTEDDQDEVNPSVEPLVDLNLSKTVNVANPEVNSEVIFTLTILNEGVTTAPGVEITDVLPSGYTFVNAVTTDGSYDDATGVWALSNNLGVNKSEYLQITATVNPTGEYLNTAEVTASDFPDSDSTPDNADTSEDDYAEVGVTPIPLVDLSLTKTVDNATPNIGDEVVFTVSVTNAGPSDATDVSVKDLLAEGFEYVSDNSGGNYDASTGIWTVGTLTAGGTASAIEITAKVLLYEDPLVSANYLNKAEVYAVNEDDINSTPNNGVTTENDYAEVQVTPNPTLIDLEVTKTVDNPMPTVGDTVTFTVTVSNNDVNSTETIVDASGVVISDKLNSGFTYVSSTPSVGTYEENSGSWVVGDLPAGATETLIIEATVNTTGNYSNTAQVTDQDQNDVDSKPANNDDTEDDYDTLIVTPEFPADVALTKTVNVTTQDVGKLVSFTVSVTNNGPAIATGVEVTDMLPSGYEFVGATGTGTFDDTTGIWILGEEIPVGGTINGTIVARVQATGDYVNVAEITATDQTDPDLTNNSDSAEITPNSLIDLSLEKLVSKLVPNVGEQIYFSLAITNDGPNEATNVEVTDALPSGYTFVSATGTGTYDETSGTWTIPTVAVDETVYMQINVTVNTSGTYLNVAEVTAADQEDTDSTPANGDVNEDDYSQQTIVPRTPVDIEVEKVVDNMNPTVGDEVTYTISVYNNPNGGMYIGDATGVIVTDVLPSGLNFVSATTSVGTYDETVGVWEVGDLANGATETLTITARVRILGNYANTAELTALDNTDPNSTPDNGIESENDQSTVTIVPVGAADLSLIKVVDNDMPNVGENVQFTLTLTNDGPGVASGVTVNDMLPAGFTFIGSTATNGSYDASTGVWTLSGLIISGASESLTIVASVNPSSGTTNEYLNTTEVSTSANNDPDSTPANGETSEDDYAEVLVTPVPQIDLSLQKSVSKLLANTGEEIVFTLTLANAGPSEATGVEVTDMLPDGYVYVSDDSGGTYDSTTGIWTVGSLASDAEIILNITVEVVEGTYLNTAEVTAANEEDINSTPNNNDPDENDQDQAQIVARVETDISVLKEVNNTNPAVGDEIEFTITTLNDGPSTATGVVVNDLLPSGYSFVSATASVGTYDANTGSWTIGEMLNGAIETLSITAEVLSSGRYTNTAELVGLDTFDPDSTPNNNNPEEDDQASVSPFATAKADLSLTKEVNNSMPNVGETIRFTIQVTNSGESDAAGIEVTDKLPAGFTYVESFATAGVYNANTGVWALNQTLVNGNTEVLTISATVNEPTGNVEDFTNWALITASDTEDPDSDVTSDETVDDLNDGIADDDEASVVVNVMSVDIGLEKSVDKTQPTIGSDVVFTMVASNLSSTEATNIGIEDNLPSGYEFVNATATSGTYDERTGIWTISSLTGNASATLTITATVLDVNDYVNVVSLAYLDQLDINPDNDSAQATIDPNCLTIYNEFSPNGDGVNDFFYIDCINQYPGNRLEVYNRWGSLVHAEDGYNNDWDGTTDGKSTDKVLPIGTYYYILDLKDGSEPISGWLYINK